MVSQEDEKTERRRAAGVALTRAHAEVGRTLDLTGEKLTDATAYKEAYEKFEAADKEYREAWA